MSEGITVVIPCARPAEVTARAIASLARQTMPVDLWEVIVVVNGPQAAHRATYEALRARHPDVTIRIITLPEGRTVSARFAGFRAASKDWVTVVDDDDEVSPQFLEGLHACAAPGVVPLTVINEVSASGVLNTDTDLNRLIAPLQGTTVDPRACPAALRFGVCKLIPTAWAQTLHLPDHLSRGSDVALYSLMYSRFDFRLAVVPATAECSYIRHLTAGSMSRGALDTASLGELLDVVAFLGDLIRSTPASRRPLVRRRLYSAAQFVHAAASQHPANRRELAEMAGLRGLSRTAGLGAPGRRRAARWLSRRLHTRGVARG